MSRIKGKTTTSDYLPIQDFNRLVDGLHRDGLYMWEAYCRLSFCSALRIGDVRRLTWRQALSPRMEVVEEKTGKTRVIKLNPTVIAKMQELHTLVGSPDPNSVVVAGEKYKGIAMSSEYINRQLKIFRVKYRLPIESFSSHTFRKTFGRFVYESHDKSAESLILLSSIFKHANLDTTKRYIGITQTEIDNVYESIQF